MNHGNFAAQRHRGLSSELNMLCSGCRLRGDQRHCTKGKTNCFFYNATITKFSLATYSDGALDGYVTVDDAIRILRMYGYHGEVTKYGKVKV